MTQTFKEYLKGKFLRARDVTWGEDDVESDFDDWLAEVDPYELLIDWAEKWHKKELDQAISKDKTQADNLLDALKTDSQEAIKWAKSEIREYQKLIQLLEGKNE